MFWQKIGPIFAIVGVVSSQFFFLFIAFGVLNLLFGVLGAIGQRQLRPLFAYSSVAHIGWIVGLMYFSKLGFFYYFILYRLLIVSLTLVFRNLRIYSLKIVKRLNKAYLIFVLMAVVLILRIGGVPPFRGFFIKLYSLYIIIWEGRMILAIVFCVFATIRLSYYINVVFSCLLICVFFKRNEA